MSLLYLKSPLIIQRCQGISIHHLSCHAQIINCYTILLKVVVNDCSLCMAKYACSAVSVYSHCRDSLYICLALLLMYCITPLGITSGAVSDWAAWLQTFHERESRAGWSSLMRQEKLMVEAKQYSHPHLPGSVPSLFRVKLRSYLRPRVCWMYPLPPPSPLTGCVSVGYTVIWATTQSLVTHLFR